MSRPCPHLGLIISVTRHASASSSLDQALRDDLQAFLEAEGLMNSGAPGARELVVSREGGQVTEADRMLLLEWAARWAHVGTLGVSAVSDLGEDD